MSRELGFSVVVLAALALWIWLTIKITERFPRVSTGLMFAASIGILAALLVLAAYIV